MSGVRPIPGRLVLPADNRAAKRMGLLGQAAGALRAERRPVGAKIVSFTLDGIDAVPVDVECEITSGLPSYAVVGLATTSVKEGATRIKAALETVGLVLPQRRIVINLAPADLRKPGSALDLPIAAAVLIANRMLPDKDEPSSPRRSEGARHASEPTSKRSHSERGRTSAGPANVPPPDEQPSSTAPRPASGARPYPELGDELQSLLVLGELGLDGAVRPVHGVLAATMLARDRGMRGVLVPDACVAEAVVVEGVEVFQISHLRELIDAIDGSIQFRRATRSDIVARTTMLPLVDMAEVRGQHFARAALELAVAGGHNVLLSGPPGTGKTMLARRVPTILPELTQAEALETTKIYSALGLANGLVTERPFRAPHHTVSSGGLLGGGSPPRPGEISLAHNGVLFLDEVPEFGRAAIEGLREPLEERRVNITRVSGSVTLPASFLLIAAANPCPCGYADTNARECICTPTAIARYRARLSGPLLDRIDLQAFVPPVSLAELRDHVPSESSAAIRARVVAARDRQLARLAPWNLHCNAEMTTTIMRATCRLDSKSEAVLAEIVKARKTFTARSIDRLLKVARTIADLLGQEHIDAEALKEAALYRAVDPVADTLPIHASASAPSPSIKRRGKTHDQILAEDRAAHGDPEAMTQAGTAAAVGAAVATADLALLASDGRAGPIEAGMPVRSETNLVALDERCR